MTAPPSHPSRRVWRSRSLREVLGFLGLSAVAYVVAIVAYISLTVRPHVDALGQGTEPVYRLFADLANHAEALDVAISITHEPLPEDSAGRRAVGSEVRTGVAGAGPRATSVTFAGVPLEMRSALALADVNSSRLQNVLLEYASLVELGRPEAAAQRARVSDSLRALVARDLADAQRIGLEDLREREVALADAAESAVLAVGVWVAFGIPMLMMALILLRARLKLPLVRLEEGLNQIAAGELHVTLPLERIDELGRLAAHFNKMTSVLRDRAQEQGRFAAAGELLAGVAHEVNNPLMAIAAVAGGRVEDPELPAQQREELEQILQQAHRAGKLVEGLLRFLKTGSSAATNVGLNQVVARAIDLVGYRLAVDEIELEQRLDPSLPAVCVDACGLEQVFVNLISNAIDAVRATAGPRRLSVETWAEDGRVHAAVVDNGPGIAPEVADALFRPFVTTKGSRGTGLGLYISRQIIREAEGDIMPSRPPEGGTRFSISLPALKEAPVEVTAATAPRSNRDNARELAEFTVLLVDDEEVVRRSITKYLARRGAVVIEAGDGHEGIAALEGNDVDVIVTDLRMPRMDGVEFYRHVQAAWPWLAARLLLLSGDITQLVELGEPAPPVERVVSKPVELEELWSRIVELAHSDEVSTAALEFA